MLRSGAFLFRKGADTHFRDEGNKNLRRLVVSKFLLVGDHGLRNGELGDGGETKVAVHPAHHLRDLCPARLWPVQQLAPGVVQEEPRVDGTPRTEAFRHRVGAKRDHIEENVVLPIGRFAREELNIGAK